MADWFDLLKVFFTSMIPVLELRAAVPLGAALVLPPFFHPIAGKEQEARDDEGRRHHIEVIREALYLILDGQHREKGQGAHDDKKDHPPGRRYGVGGGAMGQVPDPPEELQDHLPDLRPVGDEDRNQSAQVQQHVKKLRDVLRPAHVKKLARDGQMPGTGDRQKLRHALDQAHQDGCKERHGFHAPDSGFPDGNSRRRSPRGTR